MTRRNSSTRARGFFHDFKEFLMQGNVVDLAVAVIIAGAFGKIVTSLIEDIITPAILNPAMEAANVDELSKLSYNGIKYGSFLAAVLNFVVIAFVIFLMIKAIEASRKKLERKQAMAEETQVDPVVAANERLVSSIDRLNQTLSQRP